MIVDSRTATRYTDYGRVLDPGSTGPLKYRLEVLARLGGAAGPRLARVGVGPLGLSTARLPWLHMLCCIGVASVAGGDLSPERNSRSLLCCIGVASVVGGDLLPERNS